MASGINDHGLYFKYVSLNKSEEIVTREGFVGKYDQIDGSHWIQWENGKVLRENLGQIKKANPSIVFEKPPEGFVISPDMCDILDVKLKKRAASERAQSAPTFNEAYEHPLYEEVDEMPRPRRRRTAPDPSVNININVSTGSERIKNLLQCPITLEVLNDPVIAEDGHTYERDAIRRWLILRQTSPLTGEAMGNRLVPNLTIKSMLSQVN